MGGGRICCFEVSSSWGGVGLSRLAGGEETDGELHAGSVFHTGPVGGVWMGLQVPRQRAAHRCHPCALSLVGGA